MCGIFGWFGTPPADPGSLFETLSRMLKHRGPDDLGFEHNTYWGLGFRRLSILDLSELGHQPMFSPDKRYWIAFNGEIYNYIEIRNKLEQQGERFLGNSDTEVLLRLLMRDGFDALKQLNGMFALAFVDTKEKTFLLARDRLGKKPLYFFTRNGHLRFASELKALLAWPDAPRQLSMQAVAEYLALSYLPSETCIFEEYQKLQPGHYLYGSLEEPERAKPSPYWKLEISDQAGNGAISERDLESLLDLLADAVEIRLRSDVPVGIFLSGGIDSGLIASLAAQSQSAVRPLALTVGFDDDAFDEQLQAEATAKHSNLEHRIIRQQQAGLKDIDRLAWFYDEPFGDASALPTMTLCHAASEHATVFLSGDGGDEAFGGYQRYINAQRYAWLGKVPKQILAGVRWLSSALDIGSSLRYRMFKSSFPDTGMAAIFDGQGFAEDPILKAIIHPRLRDQLARGGNPVWQRWEESKGKKLLTRQQALDFALYLPDDILVKADRASMANSIELRSPLLDYRLVEWAARLPRSVFLNTKEGKIPLRLTSKKLLPETISQGKKRGFGVPLGSWFRQPSGQDFARERLLSLRSSQRNLFDDHGVKKMLVLHGSAKGRDFGEYIWRLLMLDAWARHYLDEPKFLNGPQKIL
jgi:asparagine synthase (glutamine-hydrolysing)